MSNADLLVSMALKTMGAVVGAVLALLRRPPRSFKEFRRQAMFSVLSGIFITPLLVLWFRIPTDPESLVAAAAVTSFASWWFASAALKILPNAVSKLLGVWSK